MQILESRGYDSCGIVSIDSDNKFVRTKFASSDRFGGDCIKEWNSKVVADTIIALVLVIRDGQPMEIRLMSMHILIMIRRKE